MRALVVYESVYGNTRAIAEAIAEGLGGGAEVEVEAIGAVPDDGPGEVDLLVAGGPTHMHGMASSMSMQMAVKAAEDEGHETEPGAADGPSLRAWLRHLDGGGTLGAAFDTRIDKSPSVTGMAARGIAKRLRRRGFELADEPQSYLVEDSEGPLADGETERARAWGEALARRLAERPGT